MSTVREAGNINHWYIHRCQGPHLTMLFVTAADPGGRRGLLKP